MKKMMQYVILMVAGMGFFSGAVLAEEKAAPDYAAECKKEAAGTEDSATYEKECVKQYEEMAKDAANKKES